MSKELVTTSPKKKKKSLKPPKTLTQSLECVLHGTIEKHERTLFPPNSSFEILYGLNCFCLIGY